MSRDVRPNLPFVGDVVPGTSCKVLDADTRQQIAAFIDERFDVGERVEVVVRRYKSKRSLAQNSRYWALLSVGADALWGDRSLAEDLHEEIAHLLLALPKCEKTGLRRRMRTPKLNTHEFTVYMDLVTDKLIELGADLSSWDAETAQMEAA